GMVPLSLVRAAVDARHRALDDEEEIDEFWCLFDVEWPVNHPGLEEARDLARGNQIRLAISNPSFELWLILHLRDHRAWLDTDGARRLRRDLDGEEGKGIDPSRYIPFMLTAAARARRLKEQHQLDRTPFPHDNPSSGVYRLLSAVGSGASD